MKISDFMSEDLVLLDLFSEKKKSAIKELLAPVIKKGVASSEDALTKAILKRESLGSTAIGNGIAIPHAKSNSVAEKAIVFGRSKKGVDFDSIDGKAVNIFFMIISPDQDAGAHLKMLARISRLLQDSDFKESLMSLSTPREIINYIKSKEI
jgi:fructose-specific phosphotransferase system IIA component